MPVPSLVKLLAVVGVAEVFQTTPFAETVPPPELMDEPPEDADVLLMLLAVVVVTLAVVTAVPAVVGADVVR